jgi:hypothetical protein
MGIREWTPEDEPKKKEGMLAGLFSKPQPSPSPIPPKPQMPQPEVPPPQVQPAPEPEPTPQPEPQTNAITDAEFMARLKVLVSTMDKPAVNQPVKKPGLLAGLLQGKPAGPKPSTPAGLPQTPRQDAPQQTNKGGLIDDHHPDRWGLLAHIAVWLAVFMVGALIGFGLGYLYAGHLQAVASAANVAAVLNFSQIG